MALQAQKAGLQDDLNDFEPDEQRPIEIHKAWIQSGSLTSFKGFQMSLKGKGPVPPQPTASSDHVQSASVDQSNAFTGAVSAKFGLPEEAIKAFSAKAVARAQRLNNLPKDTLASQKYRPLKGVAKEEASIVIDQALTNLLQVSQKHGTDPTAASKLFQKKLNYFTSSLWGMWQMNRAVKRATKDWENEENGEENEGDQPIDDDEKSHSDGDNGMFIA